MKLQLVILSYILGLLNQSCAQVNQVIDAAEDLLAIESELSTNEIIPNSVVKAIKPPPPGFPGERLISLKSKPKENGNIENSENPDGKYEFSFVTDDGTIRKEEGSTDPKEGNRKTGGWEYVGPDGKTYSMTFVADQNGFRAEGDHLPKPPPLPPALQRFEDAKNGVKRSGINKQLTNQNHLKNTGQRNLESVNFKRPSIKSGRSSRDFESAPKTDRTTSRIRFNTRKLTKSGRNLAFQ